MDGTIVPVGLVGTVRHSHDGGRAIQQAVRVDRKGLNTVAGGSGQEVNAFGEAEVARQGGGAPALSGPNRPPPNIR